ncbi:MAG TPA: bifunctional diaminohydroxyphosphoribosylaminopyrimidine deaminase/5-amino-6-(5-phosphoribosylamino)uracil reductase RibD [Gammaproteobacteria bacterium]|jgi:diaminohydroxyphosphoribosylaminopyrimidine deaminase/5-amino-6-(5-phosphoribosylamino)uracil reductase
MTDGTDHEFMARALELAGRAAASSDPNPAVGCVIVRDGRVVGEGFTQRAGGNHAEIEALEAAGEAAAGATVYVSLEPCAHTGRTGPCAEALIKAAVARVVYALEDPNPAVAGKGAAMLAAAGIATEAPVLAAAAREINRGYCARIERGRPWVRCKMAASLDGRTALANGASQWITGTSARRDVHRWRARASAILTGVGTVIADDPALSARPDDDFDIDVLQPVRVIVDSGLRTPPGARTLGLDGQVVIFTGNRAREASGDRAAALEQAGAQIETVTADPRCRLDEVLARLTVLEVNDVWLESGPTLAGAMLAAGLIDELVLYFAPSLLGTESRGMFSLPNMTRLDEQIRLEIDDLRKVGEDLRIVARTVPG